MAGLHQRSMHRHYQRRSRHINSIFWAILFTALLLPPSQAFSTRTFLPSLQHAAETKYVFQFQLKQIRDDTEAETLIVDRLPRRREFLSQAIVSLISYFNIQDADAIEPQECANGAIIPESAVPGAYQQICMGLPTREITLKSTGDKISILQGFGDDQGFSGRTGVALWNSGILLTRLLDLLAQEERGFFNGKTVLELGCGTALTTIAASKLGAVEVISTDGNEEVISLAKQNLENNNIFPGSSSNTSAQRGEVHYLKWGSLDAVDFYESADIVIGSDLTYNSGSWGLLAETFDAVLKPNGIIIYLTLGHSGFNVIGELGGFLTLVESQGALEVIKEGSSAWPFQSVSSLEKLISSSLNSKEREVIASTGGFKAIVLRKKKRRR
jgi:SAM-dependent methyltransferase